MKKNVKIFEINVKPDLSKKIKSKDKFSSTNAPKIVHKRKQNSHPSNMVFAPNRKHYRNEKLVHIESRTWEDIFLENQMSSNWNIVLTCLLEKIFPDCLLNLEDPCYDPKQLISFSAKGKCQITSCDLEIFIASDKNCEMKVFYDGCINHKNLKTDNSEGASDTEISRDKIHEIEETECEMARICQYCLKYFEEPQTFYEHRNIHVGVDNPFLCLMCSQTFSSAELRNVHYLDFHNKFKCQHCNKDFTSLIKLTMHLKNCTFGQILQCTICNKTFANKRNLRDHNDIFHGPESVKEQSKYNFPCSKCDKVFYKKSNLTSHLLRHSDITPFVCGVNGCGKGFKREKTLLKHFQLMHEGIKDEFLCVHCGQQFMSQTGLRTHVSIHTGQDYIKRNVKCDVCGKAFRCQADLKTHSVVHTKSKPYSCEWPNCGISFSQKASLKDHMNVHENKFQCEGCKKSFGRERYLILHSKTCVHLSRNDSEVPHDSNNLDHANDNASSVQHIIITTEESNLMGEMSNDIEMTQVQVVQSENGDLSVTMLVNEESQELHLVKEEASIEVVQESEKS